MLGFVGTVTQVAAPWPVLAGVRPNGSSGLHRLNQGHGEGQYVMADLVYGLGVVAGEQKKA